MVPPDAGVGFEHTRILVVEVEAQHFRTVQSVSVAASPATATTAWESHVVGVVGTAEEHQSVFVLEDGSHDTLGISAVSANSEVNVAKEASVHAPFQSEVEHGLLIAIVNAGDAREVAFLIICLDAIDDGGRQVLEGGLGIARHEFLAIDEDFLDFLAINLDFTIVVHLGTGKFLHQFLYDRPFGCPIGGCVIDKGVLLDHHLGCHAGGRYGLQHDGVARHGHLPEVDFGTLGDFHVFGDGVETDTGDFKDIGAGAIDGHGEIAVVVGENASDIGAIGFQQLKCGLHDSFFRLLVDNSSLDVLLSVCRSRKDKPKA